MKDERLYKDISSSGTKQKILKKNKKKDTFKVQQNQDIFNKQKDQQKGFIFTPTMASSDDDEEYEFVEFNKLV